MIRFNFGLEKKVNSSTGRYPLCRRFFYFSVAYRFLAKMLFFSMLQSVSIFISLSNMNITMFLCCVSGLHKPHCCSSSQGACSELRTNYTGLLKQTSTNMVSSSLNMCLHVFTCVRFGHLQQSHPIQQSEYILPCTLWITDTLDVVVNMLGFLTVWLLSLTLLCRYTFIKLFNHAFVSLILISKLLSRHHPRTV